MTEVKRERRDITDTIKDASGLIKENYLAWLEITISLWEENLKVINNQLEKWVSLQDDYINFMKDFSQKFPKEGMRIWNEGLKPLNAQTDRFLSLQRDYVNLAQNVSNKFIKDLFNLNQKSIEKALSAFNDYLGLLR